MYLSVLFAADELRVTTNDTQREKGGRHHRLSKWGCCAIMLSVGMQYTPHAPCHHPWFVSFIHRCTFLLSFHITAQASCGVYTPSQISLQSPGWFSLYYITHFTIPFFYLPLYTIYTWLWLLSLFHIYFPTPWAILLSYHFVCGAWSYSFWSEPCYSHIHLSISLVFMLNWVWSLSPAFSFHHQLIVQLSIFTDIIGTICNMNTIFYHLHRIQLKYWRSLFIGFPSGCWCCRHALGSYCLSSRDDVISSIIPLRSSLTILLGKSGWDPFCSPSFLLCFIHST